MDERRRNWTYVTENTEYYISHGRCVAVRDLRNGQWLRNHYAVGSELWGSIPVGSDQPRFGQTRFGEQLLLVSSTRQLLTSALLNVYRPSRRTVHERFPIPNPKRSWAAPSQPHAFPEIRTQV